MSEWETYPPPVRREIYAQAYEEVEISDEFARHYGLTGGRPFKAYSALYRREVVMDAANRTAGPRISLR